MSHTPGPWGYHRIESGEFVITDLRPPLPGFTDSSVGKMGLNEADAMLVAAAPDLLAALKDVMADAESVDAEVWEVALMVIAKAEGLKP